MTIENTDVLLVNRGSDSYQIKYEKIKQDIEDSTNQFPEAPEDGKQYGRQDADWTEIVHTPEYTDADVDAHLNKNQAEGGQILSWDGTDYKWVQDETGGGDLTTYQYPGGVTRSIQSRLEDYVSPRDFGAKGDGTTDDTNALRAAIDTGRPVDGAGYTYLITSRLICPNLKLLKDCTITYPSLSEAADGFILRVDNGNGFLIDNVKFIYGENPQRATGYSTAITNIYRGLRIENGKNFTIRDCEFTGNGAGTHLFVNTSEKFSIDGCKVYDSNANDPAANNDAMNGIYVARSKYFTIANCTSDNLTVNGVARFARGYITGQCNNFSIVGCSASVVDQGFDISGSNEGSPYFTNSRFVISACTANVCSQYGFKFANAPEFGMVSDCVANKCGRSGYSIGATGTEPTATRHINVNNCMAINTGYPGPSGVNTTETFGFEVVNGDTTITPLRCEFNDCSVIQEDYTIQAAYKSSVSISTDQVRPPTGAILQNCNMSQRIAGQIRREFQGAIGPQAVQLRGASWTYPGNSVPNLVYWSQDGDENWDPQNMHNRGTSQVYIKDTGIYTVTCGLSFSPGAQDYTIRIKNNGRNFRAWEHSAAANTGVNTFVNVSWTGRQSAGSYLEIDAQQNGGYGPIDSANCHFSVTRVA